MPSNVSNASITNNGAAQIDTADLAEVYDMTVGSASGTGSLRVTDGSLMVWNNATFSDGSSVSGELLINGGNMTVVELMKVGDNGGAGSMTMTSGTFTAYNVNFGHSGQETLGVGAMSGGTWISGQFWVGYAGNGAFELSGGNMQTGILGIGHESSGGTKGTLNITGGRLEAAHMVAGSGATSGSEGIVNITDGHLVTGEASIGEAATPGGLSDSGLVTVSGGTWENSGTIKSSSPGLKITGGLVKSANFQGRVAITGGMLQTTNFDRPCNGHAKHRLDPGATTHDALSYYGDRVGSWISEKVVCFDACGGSAKEF